MTLAHFAECKGKYGLIWQKKETSVDKAKQIYDNFSFSGPVTPYA